MVCTTNSLYFLCGLRNILIGNLLNCNDGFNLIQSSLTTKMRKVPRTVLHHFVYISKSSSLLFSLSYSQYTSIFEYAIIFIWKFNLTLTYILLSADYLSDKLLDEKAVFTIEYWKYLISTLNL